MEKPLKRLRNDDDVNTGLKPGENEIEDFGGKAWFRHHRDTQNTEVTQRKPVPTGKTPDWTNVETAS